MIKYIKGIKKSYLWTTLYFLTLLLCHKWHVVTRNLRIGDIFTISDKNAVRGEWRLAKVMDVNPVKKGMVQNVQVMVCSTDGKPNYT